MACRVSRLRTAPIDGYAATLDFLQRARMSPWKSRSELRVRARMTSAPLQRDT